MEDIVKVKGQKMVRLVANGQFPLKLFAVSYIFA